jgi:hypothetical protein
VSIKEVIQERALKAASEYRVKFINEQKQKYEQTAARYEELLTEHYKLEFRLEFMKALNKQEDDQDRLREMEELKQHQLLLMKKIRDIENSGALEAYDAVMEAVHAVEKGVD